MRICKIKLSIFKWASAVSEEHLRAHSVIPPSEVPGIDWDVWHQALPSTNPVHLSLGPFQKAQQLGFRLPWLEKG